MIASEREPHCPFLNRSDDRCSTNFRLDHLGQAFDYCFGAYIGCAVYQELLAERRMRRAFGAVLTPGAGMPGRQTVWTASTTPEAPHAPTPLVQLTLSGRRLGVSIPRHPGHALPPGRALLPGGHALPGAAGAGVSAAPGL